MKKVFKTWSITAQFPVERNIPQPTSEHVQWLVAGSSFLRAAPPAPVPDKIPLKKSVMNSLESAARAAPMVENEHGGDEDMGL